MTPEKKWNIPLIHDLFFALDADSILKIPLRRNMGEDFLAWLKEKTGIYSVRSADRALVLKNQGDVAVGSMPVSSSYDNGSDKWKRLWKLSVVPKVRVFLVESSSRYFTRLLDSVTATYNGKQHLWNLQRGV